MEHLTAGLVAAGARDAAAVLGQFALARAAAQIDLAAGDSVEGAATAAQAVADHLAEVLQGSAGDVVITTTVNLEPTRALFEPQFAPRQHAQVGAGGARAGQCSGLKTKRRTPRQALRGSFQQHRA